MKRTPGPNRYRSMKSLSVCAQGKRSGKSKRRSGKAHSGLAWKGWMSPRKTRREVLGSSKVHSSGLAGGSGRGWPVQGSSADDRCHYTLT